MLLLVEIVMTNFPFCSLTISLLLPVLLPRLPLMIMIIKLLLMLCLLFLICRLLLVIKVSSLKFSIFLFFFRFVLSLPSRTNDSGLLTHKETLPVRSLVLGDVQRSGSESAYRVGHLRCHGDSK